MRGVGPLMDFNGIAIGILFCWFLAGLYALKQGAKVLKAYKSCLPYYNLAAVFLGPVALVFCGAVEYGGRFLAGFTAKKASGNRKEIPLTIIDEKGNDIFTAIQDDHSGAFDLVKLIIYSALEKQQVSDIFIDPKNGEYTVRFRVEGQIRLFLTLDERMASAVISIIKVAANMDIAEKRRPQDGAFSALTEQMQTSFRVASVGVMGGEKITIRIISSEMGQRTLKDIGFSPEQYRIISSAIRMPSGMILMCGPTGSGKTSTLYAMLSGIDYNLKNVISIEDPVERMMPMISQMEVNVKAGITFASLLRNALRQNPDVICLGEIRDEETAEVAVHAAQTGHLIIATLHSNDSIGTIVRLMDLGIPLRSIAAALHVIVSQRLIRKLCTHCRKKAELSPDQQAYFAERGISTESMYVPCGCPHCDGTGYSGRRALFEILLMDTGLRAALEEPNASNTSIKAYLDAHQGAETLREQALRMVERGETSWDELERITVNL